MTEQLQKKVRQAIRLLQSVHTNGGGGEIEIAYSGGKDSDVILQLARMAEINYEAIYKNTTIDPPGTIKHCRENGVTIKMPPNGDTFFRIVSQRGLPSRFVRFCCERFKEYPNGDHVVIGVRKSESIVRAKRYSEPVVCKIYPHGKHVQLIYPILEWTDDDVLEFVMVYGVQLHPLYYREDGSIDVKRRLGCLACPLKYYKRRQEDFLKYPNLMRSYVKNLRIFFATHPDSAVVKRYESADEQIYRDVFFIKQFSYDEWKAQHPEATGDWFINELQNKFNFTI